MHDEWVRGEEKVIAMKRKSTVVFLFSLLIEAKGEWVWKEADGVCGVAHSINNKDARPNWKVHAFKAKSWVHVAGVAANFKSFYI